MFSLLRKIQNTPEIKNELIKSTQQQSYSCKAITFVNPYSYQILRKKENYYQNIDHVYSDGIFSSKVFSFLFRQTIARVSFDYGSFAKVFFEVAEEQQFPVFIVGSKEKSLEEAIINFKTTYPNLNICGYHHGYFTDTKKILSLIKKSGAQYVICGLGTPKQEQFSIDIKNALSNQIKQIYTCGGFLHQSSNSIKYYPEFVNKFHLRWLYRAIKEPIVIKRLLFHYPKFIFVTLKDFQFK